MKLEDARLLSAPKLKVQTFEENRKLPGFFEMNKDRDGVCFLQDLTVALRIEKLRRSLF